MIYSFTPFAGDKNYGKVLNEHCKLVPNDNDWILIRDCDTAFLTPDFPQQIEAIVEKYKDQFDLIGCYTNRIGIKHQLLNGNFSEDSDVRNHISIAKNMVENNYDTVSYLHNYIGGFFMLFPKKSWLEHPFEECLGKHGIDYNGKMVYAYFDYWFSSYFARKKRVGIANGIYLFHVYRLFAPNRHYREHLK